MLLFNISENIFHHITYMIYTVYYIVGKDAFKGHNQIVIVIKDYNRKKIDDLYTASNFLRKFDFYK